MLAGKDLLHTTDDGIVLHVRKLNPPLRHDSQRPVASAAFLCNNDPIRIYVPLLMRPWVMEACHSTASCHLGTTRTANDRMFLLVVRYKHLHPVVASPLREVLSTGNLAADDPLIHHFDSPN